MDQIENDPKKTADEVKRKPYSKPRLEVYGDLREIARTQGNRDPTSLDAPSSHHKSQ
jgi:hypothetical protein